MEIAFTYDDVLLVPKYGLLDSRSEADISTTLAGGIILDLPFISAPMQSVTEVEMANAMRLNGGFGFIHRHMPIHDQVEQVLSGLFTGCAIGAAEDYRRYELLYDAGCRVFCIDIAHAHSTIMDRFLRGLEKLDSTLVVGNVATADGAKFLEDLGADAVKVGIGPGAACITREVSGFGVPQLSAINEVADAVNINVIADGGIKNSGDVVKALAAGADSVMLGSLLAGCDESPHPGLYWGMASEKVNQHNAPEGIEGTVPRTGPVRNMLKKLAWGVKSGISYGGGTDIKSLRENAEWLQVSSNSRYESGTRLGPAK